MPGAEVSREGGSRQCQEPAGSASARGGRGGSRDWHTSPRGLQRERDGHRAHAEGAATAPLGTHNAINSSLWFTSSSGRVSRPIRWSFEFSKNFDGAERKMPPAPPVQPPA